MLQDAKTELKNNPRRVLTSGRLLSVPGTNRDARIEFISLHKQYPKDNRRYAQILIQQNKMDDAAKLSDDILKNSPKDLDALILRGQIFIRQGKAQDAVNLLDRRSKMHRTTP